MAARKQDQKCSLFPYEIENVLSLQEVSQQIGWNISAFDLPNTWKISRGEGVKIAVLDTGCDLDHPDLDRNLLQGKNFVTPGRPPIDDCQHGTHVSGIIAAENNNIGMVGVAPDAKIIPVKVLDKNGNGNLSNVAKGIHWSVDYAKADIICMSLGSPQPIEMVRKAIQYAASKGVPCFVAAGNAGNTKNIFYPANYPETIAIGSINEDFNRSSFSNTGKNLDFMAPGGRIFSTVPDNWYAFISGTSMATPFVVGVAALVLSFIRKEKVNINLNTVEDYRNVLRMHTIPIKNINWKNKKFYQGFGIIDPQLLFEHVHKKS